MTIPKNTVNNTTPQEYISLDTFLSIYTNIENGYKYEWNNGKVEKTKNMDQKQLSIQNILMRLFFKTTLCDKGGIFAVETDMKTSEKQLRRPDLAIYYSHQEEEMIAGKNQIAPWIGEVISDSDNVNKLNTKIDEYFAAGVQVVWHIFPLSKQVHVYTTASDQIKICRGKEICSAKPALKDFEISANDLFAYQEKYKKMEN